MTGLPTVVNPLFDEQIEQGRHVLRVRQRRHVAEMRNHVDDARPRELHARPRIPVKTPTHSMLKSVNPL